MSTTILVQFCVGLTIALLALFDCCFRGIDEKFMRLAASDLPPLIGAVLDQPSSPVPVLCEFLALSSVELNMSGIAQEWKDKCSY